MRHHAGGLGFRCIGMMAGLTLAGTPAAALACGCFTPPDPSVPVLQAGERLVFGVANGTVTAHIQIQYQGAAAQFGWLLPLPSVPTLELGTDELFTKVASATQPSYRLFQRLTSCNGTTTSGYQSSGFGCSGGLAS